MGRGKNSRRRASLDGPSPVMNHGGGLCGLPGTSSNGPPPTNPQEVRDAIEFHWKNLSMDLKQFLLKNPQELSLRKFVDYWTNPVRIENTSPNIAASICGCSWYLALNYMSIGQIVEARALILNGCFLQQCYNKPIEEIASVAQTISGEHFRTHLPFFTDGLLAISSEERMANFLKNKVSSDYQRRMSFATQTTQTKKKVQDYVNQIGSDWNNGGGGGKADMNHANGGGGKKSNGYANRRRRASVDSASLQSADSFIEIKLIDSKSKEETKMRYGLAMPLKSLFKKYAEDRDLNLRQLRFSYEGRTLFLSGVGSKTPQDLGMKTLDSITVVNNADGGSSQEESSSSSSDESKENHPNATKSSRGESKRKGKSNRRLCRRASWAGHETISEEDRLKLLHSRQLSRVFTEVAPQFEQIRQKLNALNLTCTPPKIKNTRRNKKPVAITPLHFVSSNLNTEGTGGKAGVPFHAIHVGAAENLYNTKTKNKDHRSMVLEGQKSISIDLHGLTKEEALVRLNDKLPEWNDIAMRGSYPWVIPVVIICGCGNQILSEVVEGWIKGNENVAKAPKKKFSRRRTM